jgi:hypothetical protein
MWRIFLLTLCSLVVAGSALAQHQIGFLAFDPYDAASYDGVVIPLEAGEDPIFMGLSQNWKGSLVIHNVGDGRATCFALDNKDSPKHPVTLFHIEAGESSPALLVPYTKVWEFLCFSVEGTDVTREQQRGFGFGFGAD